MSAAIEVLSLLCLAAGAFFCLVGGIGLVIHANSITLTPGTITVEAEHGRMLVHALTREAAASLAGSEMDRRCAAMEPKP